MTINDIREKLYIFNKYCKNPESAPAEFWEAFNFLCDIKYPFPVIYETRD